MPRRLAQQRMTLSDLQWPFYGSSVRIARYLCGSCASCYITYVLHLLSVCNWRVTNATDDDDDDDNDHL